MANNKKVVSLDRKESMPSPRKLNKVSGILTAMNSLVSLSEILKRKRR